MDQEFIRLMRILLGNHGITIAGYGPAINAHVANLNAGMHLQGDHQFIGNHVCPGNHSSPVIGPVVFASSGEQPVFAVFGLNPKFGAHTCPEKHWASNDLTDYAAFYNSNSCNPSGVFPFVIPYSDYYKNLFMIFNSLLSKRFISVAQLSAPFQSQFPGNNNAIRKSIEQARVDYCISLITKCPIIVPELVPFHSPSTKINISSLYTCMPVYKDYHKELLNVIDNKMHPNGILFAHGSATSKAIRYTLFGKLTNRKRFHKGKKTTHLLATWNGRIVIILYSFLRSRGAFNGYNAIKALVNDILAYMGSKSIPCNCPNLIIPEEHITQQKLNPQSDIANQNMGQKKDGGILAKEDVEPIRRRKRRGEVGEVRTSFTDDTKGLRAHNRVEFPESRKKGAKLIRGNIDHIFLNTDTGKEEAKIIGDDGRRYYRYPHEIHEVDDQ